MRSILQFWDVIDTFYKIHIHKSAEIHLHKLQEESSPPQKESYH